VADVNAQQRGRLERQVDRSFQFAQPCGKVQSIAQTFAVGELGEVGFVGELEQQSASHDQRLAIAARHGCKLDAKALNAVG
jgi:hypothetical protein